jgi:hypothetical protein
MEKGKVLVFPKALARPVQASVPPVSAGAVQPKRPSQARNSVTRKMFNVLLIVIVILNRPLSWFLNAVFGFYALAWLFSHSSFHAMVAAAAVSGGVLVKYILMRYGKSVC